MRPVVVAAWSALPLAWAISRWQQMATWGATDLEARARMPGDEVVGRARYSSTHAVAIRAPAERVWPWLVQLGQGRGGLYSYDWLENLIGLDIHSAERLDPSLQGLTVGDVVRLVPQGTQPLLRFVVAQVEPPHLLVLGPDRTRAAAFEARLPYPAWTFQLTPTGPHRCRLLVRFQTDFAPTPVGWLAYKYALQPVHFLMERKMMLGIKQRAERTPDAVAPLHAIPA